jgi:hypothetical protein
MRILFLFLLLFCPIFALAGDGVPVIDLPYEQVAASPGFEERGPEFAQWLSPAVRIGGASGTMVYYDGEWMYILSAGHLFGRGYTSVRNGGGSVVVEVFYQGNKKLVQPKAYTAQLMCKIWGSEGSNVYDVSVLRFKPDWAGAAQQTMPIAAVDYQMEKGKNYHSVGCDGKTEPAHYLVEFIDERHNGNITELFTKKNGPRGGRSGGGVFSDDGQLVMVCSRGDGYTGIWTSLNQIHKFLKAEGLDYVLTNITQARLIPIVDRLHYRKKYPQDYIPVPGRI